MSTWRGTPAITLVAVVVCAGSAWAQSSSEVRALQQALNVDRRAHGQARIAEDGVLGPRTRAAIRDLQQATGLPVTGRADATTRSVARQGRRAAVRALQRGLNRYRAPRGMRQLAVDGKYGNKTYRAIGDLQQRAGLPWTGRMDARTRAALRDALGDAQPGGVGGQPAPPNGGSPPAGGGSSGGTIGLVGALTGNSGQGGPRLARGEARKVGLLQTRLNDERRKRGQSPIGVDGAFGPQTERAVRDFQQRAGLPPSGIVDSRTWNALVNATAKGPLGRVNPAAHPTTGHRYKRNNTGSANVEIHRLESAAPSNRRPLAFESKYAVDADGDGDAWRSDPWGQPTTSLIYSNGKSLNPTTLNYFVLPIGFDKRHPGMRLGDIAAVIYKGRVAYAIYGDRGPRTKIGEGSIRLARELGIPPSPIHGGVGGGVQYVVFPGSGTGRPLSQAEINRRGARLLREMGGNP